LKRFGISLQGIFCSLGPGNPGEKAREKNLELCVD